MGNPGESVTHATLLQASMAACSWEPIHKASIRYPCGSCPLTMLRSRKFYCEDEEFSTVFPTSGSVFAHNPTHRPYTESTPKSTASNHCFYPSRDSPTSTSHRSSHLRGSLSHMGRPPACRVVLTSTDDKIFQIMMIRVMSCPPSRWSIHPNFRGPPLRIYRLLANSRNGTVTRDRHRANVTKEPRKMKRHLCSSSDDRPTKGWLTLHRAPGDRGGLPARSIRTNGPTSVRPIGIASHHSPCPRTCSMDSL